MAQNENSKATRFSAENQPANPGRKKKIYTVLKEQGFSKDDIRSAFGELAWYSEDDLKDLSKDTSKPMITRIVAKQFLEAYKRKDWNKIRDIIEHTIGKPPQDIGISDKPITGISFNEE